MNKILLLLLCSTMLSCSSNKVQYFEGNRWAGGLTLEFNLQTKKYVYWGLGFQGRSNKKNLNNSDIKYSYIYFEGKFKVSNGIFQKRYLLYEPKEYYYLPINTIDSPLNIEFCNNLEFSENILEFKKIIGGSYKLIINEDIYKTNSCIQKLCIENLDKLKSIKKIDFKDLNFLNKTNFRLIK